MKAERRHELQTNTLAQFLNDLPFFIRFHANKVLVGVIVLCLVVILIRYRTRAAAQAMEVTRSTLVGARLGVEQLKVLDQRLADDTARAQERKKIASQVLSAMEQVLATTDETDDAAMRADALALRGDLNWAMANLPPLKGATTQPALASPKTTEEFLDDAAGAYRQILDRHDSQKIAKASALLGLAAIEENRGNWDQAVERYNALLGDPTIAEAHKIIARVRISQIPEIRTPVFLGSYSSTQPTTAPATQNAQ